MGKYDSLVVSNSKAVNILNSCQYHCATYNNKKCFLRGTNHRHIPRRLPCWSRATSTHVDKATQRKRTSRRRDQASTEGVVQNQRIHDTRGVACPRRSDIGGRGYPRRWSRIESRARHACSLRREVLRSNPAKTCVVLTVTGPQFRFGVEPCWWYFSVIGGFLVKGLYIKPCPVEVWRKFWG